MINLLNQHRTVRKYATKSVDEALLSEILFAGTRASTTGNMQVYSIIVSRDHTVKEKLSPCHFNQSMVREAPVLLTFCADYNRFNKWCHQRKAEPGYDNFLSFLTGATDALLVAQNVCIAAESKGLGICYLGTTIYTAEKIIEILELPSGVVPVTTVTLGYPDESPDLTDRLPLDGVVHYEKYHDYSPERIDEIYSEKENLPANRKFIEENQQETLAQVFTNVRYKKKDNEVFSSALLEVLKKQGFLRE